MCVCTCIRMQTHMSLRIAHICIHVYTWDIRDASLHTVIYPVADPQRYGGSLTLPVKFTRTTTPPHPPSTDTEYAQQRLPIFSRTTNTRACGTTHHRRTQQEALRARNSSRKSKHRSDSARSPEALKPMHPQASNAEAFIIAHFMLTFIC